MRGTLVWGSPQWLYPSAALLLIGIGLLVLTYRRAPGGLLLRGLAPALKLTALGILAVILLEPLLYGSRPRPGSNLFLVVVDDSASLQVREQDASASRGERLRQHLGDQSPWFVRLGQDFDVRRYAFDNRLRGLGTFRELTFQGDGSQLGATLQSIASRYAARPLAGVLLITDGNSTDALPAEAASLPPIYPVVLGSDRPQRDVRVERVVVTEANFQAAPITVVATVAADQVEEESLVVELLSEQGESIERQTVPFNGNRTMHATFRIRPDKPGIRFYQVRAYAPSDAPRADETLRSDREATIVNNTRHVMVRPQQGPYRVLYVGGRPNWEFKFLRRAIEPDTEVNLTALLRIAKREPKFDFRGRSGESSNPLFRGFENQDPEEVERFDQPVLLRLNVADAEDLQDGFPQAAEDLYEYDALILDDVEAAFFSADQMTLVQRFVSQRGGGLMMLGGQESFAEGGYRRTPIGDLLPVYIDSTTAPQSATDRDDGEGWRLELTREGRLQPWVRVRSTEQQEQQRLESMPGLRTLNPASGLKPGASVLMAARRGDDESRPALAAQNFGRGRAAAMLIGDLWRWGLHRDEIEHRDDFDHAWQQAVRWLVADVPRRVEADTRRQLAQPGQPVTIDVRVRDPLYQPLDNAQVQLKIELPDGKPLEMVADADADEPGLYRAAYVPRLPGVYRAEIQVSDLEGARLDTRTVGWVAEPAAEEFARLAPNRRALERIARQSSGEVVELSKLDSFVRSLPSRKVPVTEPWIYPLWHRWPTLALVLGCLFGEWTLRRWRGLP